MKRLSFLIIGLLCLGSGAGKAQINDILNFDSANGATPYGSLVLSVNKLYGMTFAGGADNLGCIFSIDTNGNAYKDLLDFNGLNGENPHGSLLLFSNTGRMGTQEYARYRA